MTYYDDRPEDLKQDTKNFLNSEYGKYIMGIIEDMRSGHLSRAADVAIEHPERYAAKYSALKEVIELIHAPLDDSTPSRA